MRVIGLYGNAKVGKDTFFRVLNSVNNRCDQHAFAKALKDDLAPLILAQWGWDVHYLTPEQKEIIRPILIAYGCAWRVVDVDHWVKVVAKNIEYFSSFDPDLIPVITDVRFENEANHFRCQYGNSFTLLGLTREGAGDPTYEEVKHEVAMKNLVDIRIELPNIKNESELRPVAEDVLKLLNILA